MDGGRSAGRSPQGQGPRSAPGRSWTQGQESDGGPRGPAGAQAPFPLCSLSAPGQFRDPTQAGGASAAGIGGGAGVRGVGPVPGPEEGACGEELGRAEQGAVEEEVRGSWKAKANS